jgi:hypothetical protein
LSTFDFKKGEQVIVSVDLGGSFPPKGTVVRLVRTQKSLGNVHCLWIEHEGLEHFLYPNEISKIDTRELL